MTEENEFQAMYPWLGNDLFNRILRKDFPNNRVNVQKYHVKPALGKNENFSSQMLRVFVNYTIGNEDSHQIHEMRYIIKAGHSDINVRAAFHEMGYFHKEIIYYEYVLPELHKLLKSIDDSAQSIPKCYETNEVNSYLIFEDLSIKNYATANQQTSTTIKHYELIVKELARWHAASAVLKLTSFKHFDAFLQHQMHTNEVFNRLMTCVLNVCADVTKTMDGFEAISEKLYKLVDKIYAKIATAVKPDETDCFVTLCHGDLCNNNIMFKNDQNGHPCDVIYVDFQVCFIGPGVTDLVNVLYLSRNADLRSDEFDRLTQCYHQELIETLSKLNYTKPLPTLKDIEMQLIQRGVCHIVMSLCGKGARNFDKMDEFDEAITRGDGDDPGKDLRACVLKQANDNELFKYFLNYYNEKGYFD